jgi:hypothetical protein
LLIPLKIFTQETLDQYYASLSLPIADSLWLDFFDFSLNYLGSIDLKGGDGSGGPLQKLPMTTTIPLF